jgi:hypothetical protein
MGLGYRVKKDTGSRNAVMERLDQGHLYPLLEQPRQTCHGWDSNNELFEQLVNNYSEYLHEASTFQNSL